MTTGDATAVWQDFNELAEEVRPLLYVARNSGLQQQAGSAVAKLIERMHRARLQAILARDEATANAMLGLAAAARALAAELAVYVFLKQDEPEKAWNCLIEAQEGIAAAMRADGRLRSLAGKAGQLRELEDRLFPPQTFTSAGLLARRQDCSICDADYDRCEHIAGRPYMGRFCSVRLREMSADHLAIVENPADRRCRLTKQGVPGVGTRNLMTWVVTPSEDGADTSENTMEALIMVANDGD